MGSQLGEILVEAGVIDQDQLDGYTARAASSVTHVGLLLLEDNICSDQDIAQAVGLQLGLPVVQLSQLRIPGYVAKMLPRESAEQLAAIPLSIKQEGGEEVLYVAFFDPTDEAALNAVRATTGHAIKPVAASLRDIHAAIKRYYVPLKRARRNKQQSAEPELMPAPTPAPAAAVPPKAEAPAMPDDGALPMAEMADGDDMETVWGNDNLDLDVPEAELEDLPGPDAIDLADDEPMEIMAVAAEPMTDAAAQATGEPVQEEDDLPLVDVDDISLGLDGMLAEEEAPPAPATATGDDSFDFDDASFDEAEFEADFDDPPAAKAAATGSDAFDFDDSDLDDDDLSIGSDDLELSAEQNPRSSDVDFLKFDESSLEAADEEIIRAQREAETMKQDRPFGVDDLDFDDESDDDDTFKAADSTPSDSFDNDLDNDAFADDIEFEDEEVASDEFIESWEDDNFDLVAGEETDGSRAGAGAASAQAGAAADKDDLDDFDFDFDIPEAPDFDKAPANNESANVDLGGLIETEPARQAPAPQVAAVPDNADDWSLDVNALFDQVTDELSGQREEAAPPPDQVDFETASRELDRLLSGSPNDATQSAGGLTDELTELMQSEPGISDDDMAFISSIIKGENTGEDDPRLQRIGSLLANLTDQLTDAESASAISAIVKDNLEKHSNS